jgi:hypothetical protein
VPCDVRDKWDEIAGQEALTQLWLCLHAQRSTRASELQDTQRIPEFSDSSIGGQLKKYQLQRERGIQAVSNKHKILARVPWRLYLANISNLYLQEKAARKTKKRVRRNRRRQDTTSMRQASVLDEFVDFLLAELQTESINTPTKAKNKLKKLMQYGKRWAKVVERYGSGILLLIPYDLTDEE